MKDHPFITSIIRFKLHYIILSIFFFSPWQGWAQLWPVAKYIEVEKASLKVVYDYQYQIDSTDPQWIVKRKMWLLLGPVWSTFEDPKVRQLDDAMAKINSPQQLQELTLKNPSLFKSENFRINKRRGDKTLVYYDHIFQTGPVKYEERPRFIWTLDKDTSRVLGYPVQHAWTWYGGRIWHAWFTPEIPFSEGPYKFMGLPGLILRLYDSRRQYIFEAIAIEKPGDNENIVYKEEEYIPMTREKFLEAQRRLRLDIINRAREAGADAGMVSTVAENLRKENNPIELQ